MTDQPPQQQDKRIGLIGELAAIVKGLSLNNVLIIALLVVIAIPTYVLWRALNDESMLNKFMSRYEEISSETIPCTLKVASVRGGGDTYTMSTGFAYQGSDRWVVGVVMDLKPDDDELVSYCATLELIVDHMRRPGDTPSPTFPNSDQPVIWHYPPAVSP